MQGWISVYRQIQKHWTWEDKPYSKGQAWIDLLLLVNHEDKRFLFGNEFVLVKRGEHITSEYILAERWGWSRKKVRTFLELLQKDNMIKNEKEDKKRTRLIICNYNDYQGLENHEGTTTELDGNYTGTSGELQRNLNNNDNNISFLSSISSNNYPQYPQFWDWVEKHNFADCKYPNEDHYYLRYLLDKIDHFTRVYGKDHIETKNVVMMLEEKKCRCSPEIIAKAHSLVV